MLISKPMLLLVAALAAAGGGVIATAIAPSHTSACSPSLTSDAGRSFEHGSVKRGPVKEY